jgi:hypothetical protein
MHFARCWCCCPPAASARSSLMPIAGCCPPATTARSPLMPIAGCCCCSPVADAHRRLLLLSTSPPRSPARPWRLRCVQDPVKSHLQPCCACLCARLGKRRRSVVIPDLASCGARPWPLSATRKCKCFISLEFITVALGMHTLLIRGISPFAVPKWLVSLRPSIVETWAFRKSSSRYVTFLLAHPQL